MMRLLAASTVSACFVLTPLTAVGGVDPFPIDELMEMVDNETRTQTSPAQGTVRSSANRTEQPTRVEPLKPLAESVEPDPPAPPLTEASKRELNPSTKFAEGTMTVGARGFAIDAGCVFMQVYRAATDSDFTATLNLVRYRASSMGAEYLTVLFHQEGVNSRLAESFFDSVYLLQTHTVEPTIQTVMVVEMYDCHG